MTSCIVPKSEDIDINWRSEIWDKSYMATPKQLRYYVERYKIVRGCPR
jgi:hypothetical protein